MKVYQCTASRLSFPPVNQHTVATFFCLNPGSFSGPDSQQVSFNPELFISGLRRTPGLIDVQLAATFHHCLLCSQHKGIPSARPPLRPLASSAASDLGRAPVFGKHHRHAGEDSRHLEASLSLCLVHYSGPLGALSR